LNYHQPPLTARRETGQKAKEHMKLNRVAKSVVLGLAVLLASSAFASNKGSLQVPETLVINGQQLAPGDYQLRWDDTGTNVEVSFMKGKKEVAKASAKVVTLGQPSVYNSAVIDHTGGKTTISEIQFAGRKYALAIGSTEKADMSGGK
jgi:hypothetical protein